MKIDSKKLMIVLLAITGLLLLALLIYGGFTLSGMHGGGTTGDGTGQVSPDTSYRAEPGVTNAPDVTTSAPDPNSSDEITTDLNTSFKACSGRVEQPTDTLISLVIDWETLSRKADMATVRVSVKICSYALFVSERNGCKLTFLGKTYPYSAPEISYEGPDRQEFTIHEQTLTMPLVGGCGSAEISASWLFRGEYSGVPIDELTLNGFIEIKD